MAPKKAAPIDLMRGRGAAMAAVWALVAPVLASPGRPTTLALAPQSLLAVPPVGFADACPPASDTGGITIVWTHSARTTEAEKRTVWKPKMQIPVSHQKPQHDRRHQSQLPTPSPRSPLTPRWETATLRRARECAARFWLFLADFFGATRQLRPGRRVCAAAVERRRGSWPPSRHRTLRPVLWFGS